MKKYWPVVLGTFCSWERANETSNLPEGKKLTPITEGLAGHDSMPPHARIPNICSVKNFLIPLILGDFGSPLQCQCFYYYSVIETDGCQLLILSL